MNRAFTRIATILAGPVIGAGILAAGLSAAGPAQAQGPMPDNGQTQSCTTSTGVGSRNGAPAALTRVGQLAASTASEPMAPTSCVGH